MDLSKGLSLGEFFRDIRYVITAPARRFAVIHERGAALGSLILLIVPVYLGFYYAGGIYFHRDPFPGYSLIPPFFVALVAIFLKLYLIHLMARLLMKTNASPERRGSFSGLVVVFGYTSVPVILALLLAMALFLLIPQEMGYLMQNFKSIGVSIMVGISISLFVWNLILVVLALRTVYVLRDLKIVAAFILGSVLMILPAAATLWIMIPIKVDFIYEQPIVAGRIVRFLAADPTSSVSATTKIAVHVDRLAYRLRDPERGELVVYQRAHPAASEAPRTGGLIIGPQSIFRWGGGDYIVGRVIGLPGESVEFRDGVPFINAVAWEEPYIAPEFRSDFSLPLQTLGPTQYLILPENRNLVEDLIRELTVDRSQIAGRQIVARWPLGWWSLSRSAFLDPHPATAGASR
jgi:signal peptidase I